MLGYPPFWQILTKWRGGSQAQFFQKKIEKIFHDFFFTQAYKNSVKSDYYSKVTNIFHLLRETYNFNTQNFVV